jgi:hypothetical protein
VIFDYATLKLIWWAFFGLVLIIFALTDGWDLGIGMLSPILGKTDEERRVILRAIEPNWEGNQTWLIIAGALTFAAWPLVYAAAFSGMYVALLLVLFALFFRPVGFKYRNKLPIPPGGGHGTRDCSSAASSRHWCSALRSATCWWARRSASMPICACCIPGPSGRS